MTTSKSRGLRAALKKRTVKTTEYRVPIAEQEETIRLHQEAVLAGNTVKAAQFLAAREGNGEEFQDAVRKAKEAEAAARELFDACFYSVRFVGIPEGDFEALVRTHPPTEDDIAAAQRRGEDAPLWHEDDLIPELLELCAQNSELSADEWREELAGWTRAERQEIRRAVLEANIRSFSAALTFD